MNPKNVCAYVPGRFRNSAYGRSWPFVAPMFTPADGRPVNRVHSSEVFCAKATLFENNVAYAIAPPSEAVPHGVPVRLFSEIVRDTSASCIIAARSASGTFGVDASRVMSTLVSHSPSSCVFTSFAICAVMGNSL
jgi:hypothetical protein